MKCEVRTRTVPRSEISWGKLSIGMERIRDIEDLKRAEEVLRESEKSVRLIVDGIAGLVAIMTPEGEVEFVNNQALEYFGKTLK